MLAKYLVGITFVGLLAGSDPAVERLYGDYHFAKEAVTLKLSSPNNYTYFTTKRAKRGGAVTSTEISRGTFSLTGRYLAAERVSRQQYHALACGLGRRTSGGANENTGA